LSFFLPFFAIRLSFLQAMGLWPMPGQLQWLLSAAPFGLGSALQWLCRSLALAEGVPSDLFVTHGIIRQIGVMSTVLWAVRF
jgi:hypothetical protein